MARLMLLATVFSCLLISQADARKWISRDGKFTIEAELIDFEEGNVILKRDDGKVTKVPLAKLSLADSKYVHEALSALGRNLSDELPGAKKPASKPDNSDDSAPEDDAEKPEPDENESEPASDTAVVAGEAPLTRDIDKWQVRPDSTGDPYKIPANQKVTLRFGSTSGSEDIVFPEVPSPFVAARLPGRSGGYADGPLYLFDLRIGKSTGKINCEQNPSNCALSPDGRYYAEKLSAGEIKIWSFASGKVLHTIEPLRRHSSINGMFFAGPNRLIVMPLSGDELKVLDVKTGKEKTEIEVEDNVRIEDVAISPGGCYIAIAARDNIKIYDTRNGLTAGTLNRSSSRHYDSAKGMTFSHDGSELAAFQGSSSHFVCWSMKNGNVVLEIQIKDLPDAKYRSTPIEWFADKSAWWVNDNSVLDRSSEKIIFTQKDTGRSAQISRRRYIDADRMISLLDDEERHPVLTIETIDKQLLATSAKILESGGTSADVGLPPLTKPEYPEAIEALQPAGDWAFKPTASPLPSNINFSKPMALAAAAHRYKEVFFSAPSAARALILLDPEKPSDSLFLYDLATRRQIGKFKPPFAKAHCLGICPQGKLAMFCEEDAKDRIDVYDLAENKHIVGFKPYIGKKDYMGKVTWAALAPGDLMLTLNHDGQLIAWSLPSCKPKWSMEVGASRATALDASRTTLAVTALDSLHLIDVATGEVRGSLEIPLESPEGYIQKIAIRGDGKVLAALYREDSRCSICTWNLDNGMIIRKMRLGCPATTITWVGKNQLLLHRTSFMPQGNSMGFLHKFDQCSVVDLDRGFLTWTYQHPSGRLIEETFGDRHWCVVSAALGQVAHLHGLTLPDPEAAKLIQAGQQPHPLLDAGGNIKLSVEVVGDFPASSSDQQNRAVVLRDGVEQMLVNMLANEKIKKEEVAPVELRVTMRERVRNTAVTVSPRLRPYESKVVLLTTTEIEIGVGLFANGALVWQSGEVVTVNDADFSKDPSPGRDPKVFYRMQLWSAAVKKISNIRLPLPIYASDVAEGLGESELYPSGTKVLRKPPIAPDLPASQDKST